MTGTGTVGVNGAQGRIFGQAFWPPVSDSAARFKGAALRQVCDRAQQRGGGGDGAGGSCADDGSLWWVVLPKLCEFEDEAIAVVSLVDEAALGEDL